VGCDVPKVATYEKAFFSFPPTSPANCRSSISEAGTVTIPPAEAAVPGKARMKTNDLPKMKADEIGFLTALVVVVLLILPMWGEGRGKHAGGIAMMAASVIGLIAYFVLFGKRLCSRGQLKILAVTAVLAAVLGAAIAIWRTRGH